MPKAETLVFMELEEDQGLTGTVWGVATSTWTHAMTLHSSGELTWNIIKVEDIGHESRVKEILI